MRRTFAGLLSSLPIALALLSPEKALAGPPEGASGKMVFDKVADGLGKYRAEKEEGKRFGRLDLLARTHDPRVGILLGELLRSAKREDRLDAAIILWRHFSRVEFQGPSSILIMEAQDWWKENEADLRRRAAQLPRYPELCHGLRTMTQGPTAGLHGLP